MLVDGKSRRRTFKMTPGEVVTVEVPAAEVDATSNRRRFRSTIVYEDADVIVIDKPAGMVVHPAPGHPRGTLVNAVLAHAPEISVAGSNRPGIVHRLDKDTSGLIVVAKSDRARTSLVEQWNSRSVEKGYVALVAGRRRAGGGDDRRADRPRPDPAQPHGRGRGGPGGVDPLRGARAIRRRDVARRARSRRGGPTRFGSTSRSSGIRSSAMPSTTAPRGRSAAPARSRPGSFSTRRGSAFRLPDGRAAAISRRRCRATCSGCWIGSGRSDGARRLDPSEIETEGAIRRWFADAVRCGGPDGRGASDLDRATGDRAARSRGQRVPVAGRVFVVAVGKAAPAMARGADEACGDLIARRLSDHQRRSPRRRRAGLRARRSRQRIPIPDERGAEATHRTPGPARRARARRRGAGADLRRRVGVAGSAAAKG